MSEIKRAIPEAYLSSFPCCITAVSCAKKDETVSLPHMKEDGYATLAEADKYIRANLPVKRKVYYKRGTRPLLKDLEVGKAIVCVLGHYVYLENGVYYSYFNNDEDEVVCVWELLT